MSFAQEFKSFAVKGNVMDLAVGVIIGGAFGKIVDSLVADLIMPLVSLVFGGLDFANYYLPLAGQAAGLPLVVRVPSQSRHHSSRALDTGADGVMVPIVSSVEQAKAVLDAAKYWPDGTRGVALGLAHERFAMRSEPLVPRFAEQNARTAIILQVEDPRGAAAADEIASMPGVDMLWLGHNDLSVALGEPGAFDHPDFAKAEQATIAAAKKHGKSAGRLAVDARQGAEFVRLGGDDSPFEETAA